MASVEMAYRDAISAAVADEMREDQSVLIMGEDIAESGGPLKTTVGLYEEFGPDRVRDTPISETGFLGCALGLAVSGFKPVVEIMFSDFLGVCYDQIANSIAKHRFMSGGRIDIPLVIRTIGGGGLRFGPQHSQTGESWLLAVPGLKIVTASTPASAYGALRAAIQDKNPVLFIEHKALLGEKGQVDRSSNGIVSLHGPVVVREGSDITVVASLMMLPRALRAADMLTDEGIEAEIIDMRVLRPFNGDVIAASVQKTSRLVTVEEQPVVGGWGSLVSAYITETMFYYLDAPSLRIGLPEYPLPYSPPLEDAALPSPERIAATIKEQLKVKA